MSRSFLAQVIKKKFVVERRMTIRYCSSASLVTSTHLDFYPNLEIHVLHLIQNHYKGKQLYAMLLIDGDIAS